MRRELRVLFDDSPALSGKLLLEVGDPLGPGIGGRGAVRDLIQNMLGHREFVLQSIDLTAVGVDPVFQALDLGPVRIDRVKRALEAL